MGDAFLTPKQKQVAAFIREFQAREGYAPSQREIAEHFSFRSLGTVQNYLVRLERVGLLEKSWNARRGLRLVPPQPQNPNSARDALSGVFGATPGVGTVPLPLLGRVAAGRPIEAVESPGEIDVPSRLVSPRGEHFVLEVRGDSMIGDGILNGDHIIVRKQADARNGQTVVALVGQEATVKRYYRHPDRVELRAANPAYASLLIPSMVEEDGKEFRIEGVVVGLIRKLE